MLTRKQRIKRKLAQFQRKIKKRKHQRREPNRLTYLENRFFELLKRLRQPLILIILVHYFGTIGYMLIEGFPPLLAFYQTFIGVSTIGYGEIIELDSAGRIFTVFLDFAGITAFFYATGVLADLFFKEDILEIYREWRMLKEIQKIKGHYIIAGYNTIARELIRFLRERGVKVVVILEEEDRETKRLLENERIKYFVIGKPYKKSTLYLANIKEAKGLITTSLDEAKNISIIVTARLLRPDRNFEIIGIAKSYETALKLRELGANHVIVPDHIVAGRIAALIFHPHTFVVANILEKIAFGEESEIDLAEFEVKKDSPLEGKTLMELGLRKRFGVTVVAIRRADGRLDMNLRGETEIYSGDVLILLGKPENLEKALGWLERIQEGKIPV
ncbi:MAG TPA: potassium channel protein [Aquifex aeolicus]|uniref:Potassium channel protein n=1 Tax=Aquifex aeolicus TaxID=63363 RepID=A0A9D0YPT0_AQUAO|nr:potassium channel protein [Aquificales bacterium]HIP98278.1 potassium channel protein [Aquifex aeolicus]HIQ26796.1 potassium channel protein [Aquifex aeolicus]